MERIQKYLDIVPLPVLLLIPFLAMVVYFATPLRWRLPATIIFMVFWITLGRLTGIGTPAAVAKMTGVLAYAGIALAALMDPGPKRKIPVVAWGYVIMGFISYIYIVSVTDFQLAIILRTQWVALVVAAMLLARTVVDSASLMRVFWAFTVGLMLANLLPLSDLLLHPGEAFRKGLGRFMPYEANSNQIGVLFSMTVVFCTYGMLQVRSFMIKGVLGGFVAIALAMALLTGSRSTMVTAIFPLLPLVWTLSKRPVVLAMMVGAGPLLLPLLIGQAEKTAFSRFDSIETSRVDLFKRYFQHFMDRPVLGLVGTQGYSFLADEAEGNHPHNAYMWLAYQGGITYLGPMLFIGGFASLSSFYVWTRRKLIPGVAPAFISLLVAQTLIMYAHGFVNGAIYYPTYTWALLLVFLSTLFMMIAEDMRAGGPGLYEADAWDDDQSDYGEYGDLEPDSRLEYIDSELAEQY